MKPPKCCCRIRPSVTDANKALIGDAVGNVVLDIDVPAQVNGGRTRGREVLIGLSSVLTWRAGVRLCRVDDPDGKR